MNGAETSHGPKPFLFILYSAPSLAVMFSQSFNPFLYFQF